MEEVLLGEYLKNKNSGMSEFMKTRPRPKMSTWNSSYNNKGDIMSRIDDMSTEDKIRLLYMLDHTSDIDSSQAHEIVHEMWHTYGNKKYIGEKFDMHKAHEVYNKYKHKLSDYSVEDVYIAINAQYHDYCPLFKQWFGDNIDNKIIESAIKFWFEDVDYVGGNKVYKYFMES